MAIRTLKFSQMGSGGDIINDDKTPSIKAGQNVLLNNPWTFLPPGTTDERPAVDPVMFNRPRFNSTLVAYEFYSSELSEWIQLSSGTPIQDGPFVIYKNDPLLPNAFDLALIGGGMVKNLVAGPTATPAIAINGQDYYGPGFDGYLQAPSGMSDVNDLPVFDTATVGVLADNRLVFSNAITSDPALLTAAGSLPDVGIAIRTLGVGALILNLLTWPASDGVAGSVMQTDGAGNLSFTSVPFPTASPLTASNDTNITLTLGGTPATSLLQPVSITPGWTGELSLARGGTSANLTPSNGGMVYSTSSALAILNGTATANLPLLSGSSAAPIWAPFSLNLGGNFTSAGALTLSGAFASTFTFTNTTNVTFPTSGTLATISQIPTGAALTSSNDTNVTITLGGSPTTALINAASLTMGWTGQLGLTRGGTAASLTASNGGVVFSNASTLAILSGTATAGQMLRSGANAVGTWSTNTWPNTTPINNLLYATSANVVGNLATQNNGLLNTDGSGNLSWLTAGTSYTPTITFFVPGDLSVVYTRQEGTYWRLANLIVVRIRIDFTPTYTTAASSFLVALPITVGTNGNIAGVFSTAVGASSANFTFPTGRTTILPSASPASTSCQLLASGSAVSTAAVAVADIPSGTSQAFQIFCLYSA